LHKERGVTSAERLIEALLEGVEQRQRLIVGERQHLCEVRAADAFLAVDPEIAVRQPGPGEAAGRTMIQSAML
jgi:hypothetical protein